MNNKIKVFLVDDDAVFLKLSEIEFRQHPHFEVETYATGEACIKNLWYNPDVIVLDYHLNSVDKNAMSGIETLDEIKKANENILVIMLSAQGEMDVALNCMQHKAFDYVMKDKTVYTRLPQIITTIFDFKNTDKKM
jgi:two-component system, OmpR family, response regulator